MKFGSLLERHLALQGKIKVGYLKINGDDEDGNYVEESFSWKKHMCKYNSKFKLVVIGIYGLYLYYR